VPSAIVVGAGIFGASLARHLARGGWQVTLVDKDRPGHERGASGDASRLIRSAHGPDRWYARSARRARDLWLELGEDSGSRLFEQVGLAWLARSAKGWEAESERALRDEGIPVERLDPEAGRELFPSFDPEGLEFILLEPEAGVLRARDALHAVVAQAESAGAQLVLGEARPAAEEVEIDGERRSADVVVWACGAWLAGLFPELAEIRVTRQDILYFGAGPEWGTPPVPAWVEYDSAFYGLGDLDGRGVKVAPDSEGPPFDPDEDDRAHSAGSEAAARRFAASRFPDLADAQLAGARVCPYALTADTNFVIARHPEHDRVWILGGGSGHGFKHGPALAEYVVGVLEGETPDPRFGLGPREPGGSLRTAGT
jgi:glycine/D-amino acid oxidase-like deaminating enzyme